MNLLGLYAMLGSNETVEFEPFTLTTYSHYKWGYPRYSEHDKFFIYTDKETDPDIHLVCRFYPDSSGDGDDTTSVNIECALKRVDNVVYAVSLPDYAMGRDGPNWPVKSTITFGFPVPRDPVAMMHEWARLNIRVYGDFLDGILNKGVVNKYAVGWNQHKIEESYELLQRRVDVVYCNPDYNFLVTLTFNGAYKDMFDAYKFLIADEVYPMNSNMKRMNNKNLATVLKSRTDSTPVSDAVKVVYPDMYRTIEVKIKKKGDQVA